MRRHRIIVATLIPLAGLGAGVPAAALAGPPLLSGYGGPGAGAQTIVGASLVNGPRGGSGNGGSTGGGSAGGATGGATELAAGSQATGAASSSAAGTDSAAVNTERAAGANRRGRVAGSPGAGTDHSTRAAGANPNPSHLGASTAVIASDTGTSWFSGADLLALVLAAGALALVALATVRLTRPEHD
jgi:hypothetical protein